MARAKAGKGESRDEADGSPATSQAEMVRAALADLGAGAKPQALQDHIKAKFDRELPKTLISNYKSTMKRKGTLAGGNGPGRPRKAAGAGGGGSVHLADLEAVRGLVGRIGADGVRRLVNVLS